jgi:acyl-CoA synthetase (AMP-forming)/AMP-acid ligase II
MSPLTFLKDPLIWLTQISEMRATISGGPNFAYDLCTRRSATMDLGHLDLTTWKVAFNGAEPVKGQTMCSFAERFTEAGFKSTAFLPCYGLAEATLLVSGGHWRPTGAGHGRVSCGRPARGQQIVIVDPACCLPVADGVEGEIWVAGANVTAGYLADDSSDLFGSLHGQRFVRTGDLGYRSDGELYVTGRMKDVLVWRGVNYHATDIEAAVDGAADGLRSVVAAFVGEDETATVLVIESTVREPDRSRTVALIRRQVLERTGLRMDQVVLVPPKTIPRTSSGKVRRAQCRAEHAAGRYDGFRDDRPAATVDREVRTRTRLTELIQGAFAAVCDVGACADTDSFLGLGGDSIRAGEVAAALEQALGVNVTVEMVLQHLTPRALAGALLDGSRGDQLDLDAVFETLDAV